MVLVLTAKRSKVTIIQRYSPTASSSKQEVEDFYDLLESTVENYQSPKTIIIGDFNSKVGCRSQGEEETLGPHGYGARNERGDKLVQFAQEQRMRIANTFFRKSPTRDGHGNTRDGHGNHQMVIHPTK